MQINTTLAYTHEDEITLLMKGFIELTLPKEKWTHDAHLTAAIWHLREHDFYEAVCLIKSRIISYNLSVGGTNTSTAGYHETLTIFWMKVVTFFNNKYAGRSLLDTCNEFLACPLASRNMPFYFYEKEKLMSPEARSIFIEPGQATLDVDILQNILQEKILLHS